MAESSFRVAILMGSKSDWDTMRLAGEMLTKLDIAHESHVLSAHRASDALGEYIREAEAGGVQVFIVGAGGAAHLAGVIAAKTQLPVLGVPLQSKSLQGLDSLLSIVQMPKGIPVATFAIGEAGAVNAALFAVAILANTDLQIKKRLDSFREQQTKSAAAMQLPE